MTAKNLIYAQSGGVTAVINATACGVIQAAKHYPQNIGKVYAAHNGIIGVLTEELYDTSLESDTDIAKLRHTPAGAFGSCRYKLRTMTEDKHLYTRLIEVFRAHNVGYFLYNGGGDSQDTANKISQISDQLGYPIQCIGIPKTIDNDLPQTDSCPGYGSVAKYVAVSMLEASTDLRSMAASSTKVFIMELMGRHSGWITAAAALGKNKPSDPPHILLFPEIAFDKEKFLAAVKYAVDNYGYCSIAVSEGLRNAAGEFLSKTGMSDAFGHTQLGGTAPLLSAMILQELGFKYHWAVLDYLQRSARHLASAVDVEQAYALGKAAVEFAIAGKNAVMPIIVRDSDMPYTWHIAEADLATVANVEQSMPKDFIDSSGLGITEKARRYLLPLIQGEDYPPYKNGLPDYVQLKNVLVEKRLVEEFAV